MSVRTAALVVALVVGQVACGGGDEPGRATPTGSTVPPATTASATTEASAPRSASVDCAKLPVEELEGLLQLGLVSGARAFVNSDSSLLPAGVERASVCNYDTAAMGAVVSVVRYETAGPTEAAAFSDALQGPPPDGSDATTGELGAGIRTKRTGNTLSITSIVGSVLTQIVVSEGDERLDEATMRALQQLVATRLG